MKKIFLALVLSLVSIVTFAQTEVQTQPMPQQPTERYVTQEEFQKSIEQMNKEYKQQMDMSGYYLEKAGKLQSAAIWVSLGGGLVGTLLTASNDSGVYAVGGVITLAAEITALVLEISSASNMKKSGLVLQGNGIAYRF